MGTVAASGAFDVSSIGNKFQSIGVLVMSSSYAASGDTLAARTVALGTIDNLDLGSAGGYSLRWNKTLGTIQAYQQGGLTLTATTTTGLLSIYSTTGTTLNLKTTQAADVVGLASALTEVTAGTDLSSIAVQARAVGV